MTTTTAFDPALLIRAIESRDADGQLALYAADAEIVIVDEDHPPAAPAALRGIAEIEPYVRDVCARDMTHTVTAVLVDADRVAFQVDCRYPDGTRVACQAFAQLRGGLIVRQDGVQAWDR